MLKINLGSKIRAAFAAKEVTANAFIKACADEAKAAEKRRIRETKAAARRAAEKARADACRAAKARKATKAAWEKYVGSLNEELTICKKHNEWPMPESDNRFMKMANDLPFVVYCYTGNDSVRYFEVKTKEDLEWLTKNATLLKSFPPENFGNLITSWRCEISLNYGVSLPTFATYDIQFTQEELLRAIESSGNYIQSKWEVAHSDQDLIGYGFLQKKVVCPVCGRDTGISFNSMLPSLTVPLKIVCTLTVIDNSFCITKSIVSDNKCDVCKTEEVGAGLDGCRDKIVVNHGLWAYNHPDDSLGGLYCLLTRVEDLPTNAQICATERNKFLGGFGITLKYPVIKASFSHDVNSSVPFGDNRIAGERCFDSSSGCKTLKAFKKAVNHNKTHKEGYYTESFVCFDKSKISTFWIEKRFAVLYPHFVINVWEFAEFFGTKCYIVDIDKNQWTPVNDFVCDIVDTGYFSHSDTPEFLWYLYVAGFCREQQGQDVKQFFDELHCKINFEYSTMLDMFGIEIPFTSEDEDEPFFSPFEMQREMAQYRQSWHKNRQYYLGKKSEEQPKVYDSCTGKPLFDFDEDLDEELPF